MLRAFSMGHGGGGGEGGIVDVEGLI